MAAGKAILIRCTSAQRPSSPEGARERSSLHQHGREHRRRRGQSRAVVTVTAAMKMIVMLQVLMSTITREGDPASARRQGSVRLVAQPVFLRGGGTTRWRHHRVVMIEVTAREEGLEAQQKCLGAHGLAAALATRQDATVEHSEAAPEELGHNDSRGQDPRIGKRSEHNDTLVDNSQHRSRRGPAVCSSDTICWYD